MTKPREFWIDDKRGAVYNRYRLYKDRIHVIEYSAYFNVRRELAKAAEMHNKLQHKADKLASATGSLLKNIGLDWYVNTMGNHRKKSSTESGVMTTVHNQEMINRMEIALNDCRKALKDWRAE